MRRSTEGFLVAVRLFKKIWGNSALKLPSEIAVLICLADHANDENKCWPSIERIASFTKLSVRTVQTTISELEKIGFLIIKRGGGKHFTNIYTINITPQPLHPRNHCIPATIADEPRNHCTPNPATAVPSVAPEPSGTVRGTVKEPLVKQKRVSQFVRPCEEDVVTFCRSLELPETDGRILYQKWEGNGWTNSKVPIKSWEATIRSWKMAGYLPSQKANSNGNHKNEFIRQND